MERKRSKVYEGTINLIHFSNISIDIRKYYEIPVLTALQIFYLNLTKKILDLPLAPGVTHNPTSRGM